MDNVLLNLKFDSITVVLTSVIKERLSKKKKAATIIEEVQLILWSWLSMINFKMDSCQRCFWSAYACIVVTSCLQEQQERLQFQYSHTQCSISSHRIIRNNISPGLDEINNRDSFSTAMAQISINNGRKKKKREPF